MPQTESNENSPTYHFLLRLSFRLPVHQVGAEINKSRSIEVKSYIAITMEKVINFTTLAGDDRPVDRQVHVADHLERVRLPTIEAPWEQVRFLRSRFRPWPPFKK
jgi:hypothetical protein